MYVERVYEFSSPIFGDMFLLKIKDVEYNPNKVIEFSSPIFGDMFLLSF